jgi:hypothetical protein
MRKIKATAAESFLSWAQRPPMGWNSWDCFGVTVTEQEVKANADYMALHLEQFGWEYIIIDGRWYEQYPPDHGYNPTPVITMDNFGRFIPPENRFPSAKGGAGFKSLADYIHNKGLKFGIHLLRGIPIEAVKNNTPILGSDVRAADIYSSDEQCVWLKDMYTIVADRRGAQEYYNSIFDLYAGWGIDYIKVDDLSSPYRSREIEMIRKAIDRCGRKIVFSMSPGPAPLQQADHASRHANLWRISNDFWDRWEDIILQFGFCRDWAPFIKPGRWPDADMLPLGRIGIRAERGLDRMSNLTKDEQITLITLWCIFRSPLMFGGDLPSNDDFTLSLITNDEVLAVNRSSTNNRQLSNSDGFIIWTANIPDSRDKYIAFFNIDNISRQTKINFSDIDLKEQCFVRDLWAKKDLGLFRDLFTAAIGCHSAGLYKISPV